MICKRKGHYNLIFFQSGGLSRPFWLPKPLQFSSPHLTCASRSQWPPGLSDAGTQPEWAGLRDGGPLGPGGGRANDEGRMKNEMGEKLQTPNANIQGSYTFQVPIFKGKRPVMSTGLFRREASGCESGGFRPPQNVRANRRARRWPVIPRPPPGWKNFGECERALSRKARAGGRGNSIQRNPCQTSAAHDPPPPLAPAPVDQHSPVRPFSPSPHHVLSDAVMPPHREGSFRSQGSAFGTSSQLDGIHLLA